MVKPSRILIPIAIGWHTIIAWRGLATFASQYIHKGSLPTGQAGLLYVEGKLRNRQYEDKDGRKKYVTEIVAEQIMLLDKKNTAAENNNEDHSGEPLPF